MHLSSGAIWQGWKSPVHAPCHQHGCRDFRAASLGAVQWLSVQMVCTCLCVHLLNRLYEVSSPHICIWPSQRDVMNRISFCSWLVFSFIAHYSSFSYVLLIHPPQNAQDLLQYSLPPSLPLEWDCLLQEENQRLMRDMLPYKAFSVSREAERWAVGPH